MSDNELIAEFIGWTRQEANASYNLPQWYKPDPNDLRKKGTFKGYPEQLKFHTSWDWLMIAVEKIGKLYEKAFPSNEEFIKRIMEHNDPIDKEYVDVISISVCTPINEVYEATVKFIKWYNSSSTDKT